MFLGPWDVVDALEMDGVIKTSCQEKNEIIENFIEIKLNTTFDKD